VSPDRIGAFSDSSYLLDMAGSTPAHPTTIAKSKSDNLVLIAMLINYNNVCLAIVFILSKLNGKEI